jgi:predicted amidohydrolase
MSVTPGVSAPPGRSSEPNVTVACVNFTPVHGDPVATLAKMRANVAEAAAQGAQVVVFPEEALQGSGSCEACRAAGEPCDGHRARAETVPGPSSDAMAELAREHDLYVFYGLAEQDPDDDAGSARLYNSVAVVGPEGVLGTYRKVHLGSLPWVTEGITYSPGTSLPLFETRFGPVGVQICFDFWCNPELTRILCLKGARLIVNAAASFDAPGRPDTMLHTAVSRAAENLVYVATANQVGGPTPASYAGAELVSGSRGNVYAGHSMITGPAFPRFGEVLARAGDVEEIVSATLSFDRLDRFAAVFPWVEWRSDRLSHASRLVAAELAALAPPP